MTDPRIRKHAEIIVNYSTEIKRGDRVVIRANALCDPLIRELYRELGKKGAFPLAVMDDQSYSRAYILETDDGTLTQTPEHYLSLLKATDAVIAILASPNTQTLHNVPGERFRLLSEGMEAIQEEVLRKRWCVTLHPSDAFAQEAGMSLEEFEDFVYSATLLDWEKETKKMRIMKERLDKAREVRIIGKETDIRLRIDGRNSIVDDGKKNLPGGEVFTAPIETETDGTVLFDLPIIYLGREIVNTKLTFEKGKIVEAKSEKGSDVLLELLNTDEGAKRLGELGIGMNRGIRKFSRNVLFDEKLGDTIHMAVGRAYEECKGTNKSAIHIDMIKNMKEDGQILLDGSHLYGKGRFMWE